MSAARPVGRRRGLLVLPLLYIGGAMAAGPGVVAPGGAARVGPQGVAPTRPYFLNVVAQHADVVERLSGLALAWQRTLPPGMVEPPAGRNDYPWPRGSAPKK